MHSKYSAFSPVFLVCVCVEKWAIFKKLCLEWWLKSIYQIKEIILYDFGIHMKKSYFFKKYSYQFKISNFHSSKNVSSNKFVIRSNWILQRKVCAKHHWWRQMLHVRHVDACQTLYGFVWYNIKVQLEISTWNCVVAIVERTPQIAASHSWLEFQCKIKHSWTCWCDRSVYACMRLLCNASYNIQYIDKCRRRQNRCRRSNSDNLIVNVLEIV